MNNLLMIHKYFFFCSEIFFFFIKTIFTQQSFHFPLPSWLPQVCYFLFYTTLNTILCHCSFVKISHLIHMTFSTKITINIPFLFWSVFMLELFVANGTICRIST